MIQQFAYGEGMGSSGPEQLRLTMPAYFENAEGLAQILPSR